AVDLVLALEHAPRLLDIEINGCRRRSHAARPRAGGENARAGLLAGRSPALGDWGRRQPRRASVSFIRPPVWSTPRRYTRAASHTSRSEERRVGKARSGR